MITPHRSLGPKGFLIFMLCIGGLSFVSGMVFVLHGRLAGIRLLRARRAGSSISRSAPITAPRRAYEEVTVTASELTVRKVSHRGRVREWTLNPLWVRLDRIVHEEFGIERLFLVSRGRRLPIAAFLGPHEKESFARALSNALGEARRGPTRTVLE